MTRRTLFHDAVAVLTLAGSPGPRRGPAMSELSIIEHASVAVDDTGKIAWVGPARDVPEAWREDDVDVVDCRQRTIMPALVDPHTHLVWGGHRRDELEQRLAGEDYEAIFAAGGGILSSVRQTRAISEGELFEQSRRRIERMRRCGTTTFEIKSGYGLDLDTELEQLRVVARLGEAGYRVVATCLAAHAIPPEARGSDAARASYVRLVCEEILPEVARQGLATYCDVFCDRGAFTTDESRQVLQAAKALGFRLRVHANEFASGGATLAAEVGAASADHLLTLDQAERAALADAGVVATLLPGTSLVLGKPFADGRALVDAGVPVAVATDCNPGSCALENLAMVLGLACYGNGLSPAQAVCAATHNAAASLKLDGEVGSLQPGRRADLLLLDTDDYRDLVYHMGSPLLLTVVQDGRPVAPERADR